MTSRDFCYWLQGFFELSDTSELSPKQLDLIQRHLNMVFFHEIDPTIPDANGVLGKIHSGQPLPPDVILKC